MTFSKAGKKSTEGDLKKGKILASAAIPEICVDAIDGIFENPGVDSLTIH